uniref:Uncharacterized protein n=1 Tax=Glossina morsitans morsitans TaxID=37546 RepID=A0A1B0FJ29_GLOMM
MTTNGSIVITSDGNITRTSKRKRQFEKLQQKESAQDESKKSEEKEIAAANNSCFTNAAFSSTPKKNLTKRRINLHGNKGSADVQCGKEKIQQNINTEDISNDNPYEVVRRPPKKKKRKTEEEVCFANPALNLELPEKQFNPYEVVRIKKPNENVKNCFINNALNLKVQDNSVLINPFEIQRVKREEEHQGLKIESYNLKIGLPFKPNMGCRIDFKDLSLSQLTPSKLLAEKLVFSPVATNNRSLTVINEESPTDISNELDCYQLVLENSINEAKLRKNGVPQNSERKVLQELNEVIEVNQNTIKTAIGETSANLASKANTNPFLNEEEKLENFQSCLTAEDLDELYGAIDSDKEESFDLNPQAGFVRNYRSNDENKLTNCKECLEKKEDNEGCPKQSLKTILRSSIRKLVHHSTTAAKENQKPTQGLITSIRCSLRRKKTPNDSNIKMVPMKVTETSIIDTSERVMKLKTTLPGTEYMKIEDLTNERKHGFRHSIRNSGYGGMKQQLMSRVFNKKQAECKFMK